MLLLFQLTACANTHGAPREQPDDGVPPSMDASVRPDPGDAAAPRRPVTIDGANPQGPIACVRDGFPPLPTVCPAHFPEDRRELAETCTLGGVTCFYLFESDGGSSIRELSCHTDGDSNTTWTRVFSPCQHQCPGASVEQIDVDVSDCDRRPLADCALATTEQAQVDLMLSQLIDEPNVRSLLNEDLLSVEFENGCPRRYRTAAMHSPAPLTQALSQVRWACALSSPCGEAAGPSTIQ